MTLLPTRFARDPESLMALHRRLLARERGAQEALIAAEALALLAVTAIIV